MSFWRAIVGGVASGISSGVTSEISNDLKKPHKHKDGNDGKDSKDGKNGPKRSSNHTSKAISSAKLEDNDIGEKYLKGMERLVEIANLTNLVIETNNVGSNHSLNQASIFTTLANLTSINATGIGQARLRPRSIQLTLGFGEEVDGVATAGEQVSLSTQVDLWVCDG